MCIILCNVVDHNMNIGEPLTTSDMHGLHRVAETYTKGGVLTIYRNVYTNLYLSTTDSILRQCGMDGDALARYLCYVAMDSNSDAYKTMMS